MQFSSLYLFIINIIICYLIKSFATAVRSNELRFWCLLYYFFYNMVGKGVDTKSSRIFHQCYLKCCKLQNLTPLNNVIPTNNGKVVDFCVDRIKYAEWAPILNALCCDLSLHSISIRCRQQVKTGKFKSSLLNKNNHFLLSVQKTIQGTKKGATNRCIYQDICGFIRKNSK